MKMSGENVSGPALDVARRGSGLFQKVFKWETRVVSMVKPMAERVGFRRGVVGN